MSAIVHRLGLTQNHRERGMRVYALAMGQNMIQGRTIKQVAAACLYVGCRQDKECQVMLIDISDIIGVRFFFLSPSLLTALKVSVFALGQIYNTIVSKLHLNLVSPVYEANPEYLIQRFVRDLEFGDDEHRIAKEAIQILQRMKRDWILVGRRPAGVCGAAVILAARMNNYRRTVREVVYTAKVADVTINKRLDEFQVTESSKLSVDEFRHHGLELEKEHDPPAYYEQFTKEKKRGSKRKRQEEEDANLAEDVVSVSSASPRSTVEPESFEAVQLSAQAEADRQAMPPPSVPIDPRLLQDSTSISQEAQSSASGSSQRGSEEPSPAKRNKAGRPPGAKNKPLPQKLHKAIEDEERIEADMNEILNDPKTVEDAAALHKTLTQQANLPSTQGTAVATSSDGQKTAVYSSQDEQNAIFADSQDGEGTVVAPSRDEPAPTVVNPVSGVVTSQVEDLDDLDEDPEVRDCMLSPEEQAIKEKVWVTENSDWLRKNQARQVAKELAERNGKAPQSKKRNRRRGRMGDMSKYHGPSEDGSVASFSSPEEATAAMMKQRSFSKKINYDMIKYLYTKDDKSGSSRGASTSRASSSTGRTSEPPPLLMSSSTNKSTKKKSAPKQPGAGATQGKRPATPKKNAAKTQNPPLPASGATSSSPPPAVASSSSKKTTPKPKPPKATPDPLSSVVAASKKAKDSDVYANEREELESLALEGRSTYHDDGSIDDDESQSEEEEEEVDEEAQAKEDIARMQKAIYGESGDDEYLSDYEYGEDQDD